MCYRFSLHVDGSVILASLLIGTSWSRICRALVELSSWRAYSFTRASLPVWVVGMSLGTYSATNSAIRLNSSVDGFAICSASTAPTGGPLPNGILDMELSQIAMPALIVGHQDDACPGTPAVAVPTIASALTYASPISQKVFTGGSPTMSQPCGPKSPHGYFGIDDEVISYMSNIILSQ